MRYLTAQGFAVEVADPAAAIDGDTVPHHADWRTLALDHELIVIAAPMLATNAILEAMAAAPPRGVVFDVGSLKSPLRAGLRALAAAGGQVTSVHPMFGPDTELLSGRHVIFIDLGAPAATAAARALFERTMATLVDMDLESHDRLIAYVLGLSHALNIAFFTALADSGEAAPRLATLSSTTFDAQLGVAAKVAAENPALYFEIQRLNDYGTESLTALLYAVGRLRSVVHAPDDADGFRALMMRGRTYLSGPRRASEAPTRIRRRVARLDNRTALDSENAWAELRPLREAVVPCLLEEYRRAKRGEAYVVLVFHAIRFARKSDAAIALGLAALEGIAPRPSAIRACSLLAYALGRDALPALRALLSHRDQPRAGGRCRRGHRRHRTPEPSPVRGPPSHRPRDVDRRREREQPRRPRST